MRGDEYIDAFTQYIEQKGLQSQRGGSAAFTGPTDENSFCLQFDIRVYRRAVLSNVCINLIAALPLGLSWQHDEPVPIQRQARQSQAARARGPKQPHRRSRHRTA